MSEAPESVLAKPRRSIRQRIVRAAWRSCLVFLALLALYLVIALVGLIPVNNDFKPTPDGVEIVVVSNGVHADFVLPVRNSVVDWTEHLSPGDFDGDVSGATHVVLGWGNKEFYVDIPTWSDVRAGTVFRALFWPSETCMHVELVDGRPLVPGAKKASISLDQYRRLVDHILGSFRRDEDGRFVLIEDAAYGNQDAFYQATGAYHAFNTCNCWVGRGLSRAGVRTGWFTPLPGTVSLYMEADAGE